MTMASFMKTAVTVQMVLFISHAAGLSVSDDIVKELEKNISDLQSREFDNTLLIQGLTSELAKQDIVIKNLEMQLDELDQKQANVTNDLDLQQASLYKVTEKQEKNANQISNLTSREGLTDSEMNKLKNEFLTRQSDLDLLAVSLNNLTDDVRNYGNEIDDIKAANKRQWVEFQELKSRIVSMFAKEEVQVAFMARYVNGSGHHDPNARILPFDNILLNAGYGYNSTFGVFTARAKGVYLLQLTVSSVGEKVLLDLVVDNVVCGAVIADAAHVQSATNAVVHLDIGSRVWVQKVIGERVGSNGLTQFSGALIQAD